ncbi:MAG: tRNA (adenosine(37)-N6)-dimethylallyltransferase MiaA [Firmicutes bacterium]|nr:tRNA (adenosine(37)-N6)-dimethylallyltransferase MiaA [Bacillota bacterium]
MNKIIVIVGPTGVGKTKLSIELAKKFDGEIINGDSTQVYRDLDIATAKVTKKEKENIRHHLLDIKDITEDYTVYDYQKDGRKAIEDILAINKTPIIVGGTGLYIKALLYDYNFKEGNIKNDYSTFSNEELYKKILEINPDTNIHINNRKKLERFLDYYYNTGEIIENNKTDKLLYECIFIGLTTSREVLYERINKRVDVMVNDGLLEEAKKIYDSNIRTKAITTPIGYKELFPYFEEEKTLEECLEDIKQKSRKYAKRQYTWFNNQMSINWFDVNFEEFNETVNQIYEFIKKSVNY